MGLYDLSNRIRAFGEKRRLNVGTAAKPRWIDNVHAGDDYALTYGNDNVYAVQPGTVIFSGYSSTYGWHVQVRLTRSIVIRYHSLAAKSPLAYGAVVAVGDFIGLTGKSASGASGNHVHIQAEDDGKPINPRPYIAGATFTPLPTPTDTGSKPIEEDDMYTEDDRKRDEKTASQTAAIADTVQAIYSALFTTEPTSRGTRGGVLFTLKAIDDALFKSDTTSFGTPGGVLVSLKALLDRKAK